MSLMTGCVRIDNQSNLCKGSFYWQNIQMCRKLFSSHGSTFATEIFRMLLGSFAEIGEFDDPILIGRAATVQVIMPTDTKH